MSTLISSYAIGLTIHWSIVVLLSIRVIMRRRPTGVSLAWLAVIVSVPLFGAIVYLFFGEQRLGRARARRIVEVNDHASAWKQQAIQVGRSTELPIHSIGNPLDHYVENVLESPTLQGNRCQLYDNFHSIFDAIIKDIDSAQETCVLGFYIWYGGGRSDEVLEAMIRAAERGVACRVLVDALGSKPFLKGQQPDRLRAAGVLVEAALPTSLVRLFEVRADLRNHRKIVVIDDRVAYTGSQNLVDPRYFKQDSGVGQWVDAMVRVEGPLVAQFASIFHCDWSIETGDPFISPKAFSETAKPAVDEKVERTEQPTTTRFAEEVVAQVVPSGPCLHPEAIHQLLLTTIYAAQQELIITTPYFVPDESVITALLSSALRGVEVTLIVPEHNDSFLVRYASVAHFDDLLSAGVKIAQFHGGLLHTKSVTVDGNLCIFGSVNVDMRSLWLNFEVSLFAYGPRFTTCVRDLQIEYLKDASLVDLETWRRRPFRRRLTENTLRLLSPLL